MKVTARQYATVLYEATHGLKGAACTEAVEGFVRLLAAKNALRKIEKIIVDFEHYYNQLEGIVPVSVVSAAALTDAERQRITQALTQATDKKIELVERLDPSLIGGIVIKIGDTVIDNSFKKHLQLVRNTLTASPA